MCVGERETLLAPLQTGQGGKSRFEQLRAWWFPYVQPQKAKKHGVRAGLVQTLESLQIKRKAKAQTKPPKFQRGKVQQESS